MQCLGFSGATEGIHTDMTHLLTFEVKIKHSIVDDSCILIDVRKINFYPFLLSHVIKQRITLLCMLWLEFFSVVVC